MIREWELKLAWGSFNNSAIYAIVKSNYSLPTASKNNSTARSKLEGQPSGDKFAYDHKTG